MVAVVAEPISAKLAALIRDAHAAGADGWSLVAARQVLAEVAAEVDKVLAEEEERHAAEMRALRVRGKRTPADQSMCRRGAVKALRGVLGSALGGEPR